MLKFVLKAMLFFAFSLSIAFATPDVLNIYGWASYIPKAVLTQFTKETGIKVNYATYIGNQMLYEKLKSNPNTPYDLIIPSGYMIAKMTQEKMLHKLDKSKLFGFNYLNRALLNKPYDPHNQYSVPYLWGSTGILINKRYYSAKKFNTWRSLWSSKLHRKLAFINSYRDAFSIALITLKKDINTNHPEDIKLAYERLLKILPNVLLFAEDGALQLYVSEDAVIGVSASGYAYQIIQENPDYQFIYPKDGPILWVDSLAIPIHAPHIQNAYRFINFILQPKIAKMISMRVGFSSPNKAAVKLMPKHIRQNRILYPTKADLTHAQIVSVIHSETMKQYVKYWELLKLKG